MKFGLLLICLLVPSTAAAQTSLPAWAGKVRLSKPVYITTASGEIVEGSAGQITADSVVVATAAGLRTVAVTDIARVQKRDPSWTGALIGAGVGLALGVQVKYDDDTCPQKTQGCLNEANGALFTVPVTGALVGWGIDALIKRRVTVYDARRATRVTLAVGPGRLAARVSF